MKKSILTGILALTLAKPAISADIVDVAVSAGSFNTLVAAVQAADLVDALKGPGPLTVLAPTDEAFAKLPKGTVEKLLEPSNQDLLVKLLTYHVIAGDVRAAQVVGLKSATTLSGEDIRIKANPAGVRLNNVNVTATDIEADNGVIHVIDGVLIPGGFLGELNSR
jgi:uncharacterized surface protein with fasciclin (FAS1) repeats